MIVQDKKVEEKNISMKDYNQLYELAESQKQLYEFAKEKIEDLKMKNELLQKENERLREIVTKIATIAVEIKSEYKWINLSSKLMS